MKEVIRDELGISKDVKWNDKMLQNSSTGSGAEYISEPFEIRFEIAICQIAVKIVVGQILDG